MSDPLLAELNRMTNHECHLIVIPDWSAKLTILIGGTHEQHFEAFKKRKLHVWECTHLADWCRDEMRHNAAVTLQPTTRPRSQFIYFPTRPNIMKAETVGTVAHELLHVTISLLSLAGIKLTASSEEAYTYLHGHLMQEFWKKVNPKGGR